MKSTNAVDSPRNLKADAGLWVDHREAFIVVLAKTGQATKWIRSNGEKHLQRSGEPSTGRFEYQAVPADDSRQREYTGQLARFYDEIIAFLHDAGSVLIFGPGEAKGELKKRFEAKKDGGRVVAVETTDKMTEPQIMAHVRHYFDIHSARPGVEPAVL
jgi:hypothetical protein